MATTSKGFRYPVSTDTPNVPRDIGYLASDVDNYITNNPITINGTPVALGGTVTITGLPTQTGNSGKYLTTNGTTASWAIIDLSSYLTSATAASTYLTITNASSTYLTTSSASSTYLTSANAASTYLTISNASSTYLTTTNASSTYAEKASPTFTGVPLAPTATAGTNTTQIATTAFVSTAVSNLVASAPSALDTLNELATALGNDASFSTTVTNSIAGKVSKSGGDTITSSAATVVGLIVKGAISQSVNIQEWQDTSGNILSKITQSGSGSFGSISGVNGVLEALTGFQATSNLAARIALTVKGAASQSANLQEWQDSAGNVLVSILSNGRTTIRNSGTDFGSALAVGTNSASTIGLVIRGTTSQTAALQQWQDSTGAVKAFIRSDGFLRADSNLQTPTIYSPSTGGTQVNIATAWTFTTNVATNVGIIIQGSASQTANLQEWQNSAGAALSYINSSGNLYVGQSSGGQISFGGGNGRTLQALQNGAQANFDFYANQTYFNSDFLIPSGKIISTANGDTGNLNITTNSSAAGIQTNRYLVVGGSSNLAQITAYALSSTTKGLVVQGTTSQTANLQEWQNVSGTVLAKITAAGAIDVTAITVNGAAISTSSIPAASDVELMSIMGAY